MWGKLKSGTKIELSNNTLSKFGENYLTKFSALGIKEVSSTYSKEADFLDTPSYREFFLELFRKEDPDLKYISTCSRFNSFFAVESINDAERYVDRFGFKGKAKIYEVFTDSEARLYDMTWLDQQFPRDHRKFGYYYRHYWMGNKIQDDPHLSKHEKRGSLMEALINDSLLIGDAIKVIIKD